MSSTPAPGAAEDAAAPESSWWARHQLQVVPWLFLAPALVMFTLYVIAPIFESMALSLYDWDGLGTPKYIGLANYIELIDDPDFHIALKNNVIWLFLIGVKAEPAGAVGKLSGLVRPIPGPPMRGNAISYTPVRMNRRSIR